MAEKKKKSLKGVSIKEADKFEVERRLRQVEEWVVKGISIRKMVENGRKKWDIEKAQLYKYINKVFAEWQQDQKKESKSNYNKAIARREFLYGRAIARKSYGLALKIERDIRELQGLYIQELKIKSTQEVKIYLPENPRLNKVSSDKQENDNQTAKG
jgi:hypothetical protein